MEDNMTFPRIVTDDFQQVENAFKTAKAIDILEIKKNRGLIPSEPGFYMFSSDKDKKDVLYIGMSTCLRKRLSEYMFTGSTQPGRTSANLLKVRQLNYLNHGKEQDRLYLTCVIYKNLDIEKRLRDKYRQQGKLRYDITSDEDQIGYMLHETTKDV